MDQQTLYEFLRKIPIFLNLPESDLARLVEMAQQKRLPAGAILFAEGDPGGQAYVIQEGQVEIFKASDGRDVQLAVRQPGEVIGEMSLLDSAPRFATGRILKDALLLEISHEQLDHLLATSPSAAKAMLNTFSNRLRTTELILRQSEKMAQLGTLTAGIAHEINNPASAVGRGATHLREAIQRLQEAFLDFNRLTFSDPQRSLIAELDELARQRAGQPEGLNALERNEREEEIVEWLEERGIGDCWEMALTLVNLGYKQAQLQPLGEQFPDGQLHIVLRWLEATYNIYVLLAEISQGTSQIGEIVAALKSYVYLDQAPVQLVDVHKGLNNTLVMLRSKLKEGVTVKREYGADLPRIQAFGSELNQVWTNILSNAIDAMQGKGEIQLRTFQEGNWVVVEIQDNGPGIPAEIQNKIFSPFFTTKKVGKGTGLGMSISYNIIHKHGGEIKFTSRPGMTCFEVRLPVNREAGHAATSAARTEMDSPQTGV